MVTARSMLSFGLVTFLAGSLTVLAGCTGGSVGGSCASRPPLDLPPNPDPCLKYCRVWVPPVYHDVPRLDQTCPGSVRNTNEVGYETVYHDVMVKPRTSHGVTLDGKTCEQQVVQVAPGGWQWQGAGDCWKYCWVCPTYKWCNKTVKEDGITYCVEEPPEYKTVAETREVNRCRQEYVPAQYKTRWVKELYQPGHYEWVVSMDCAGDSCSSGCPAADPCRRAAPVGGVTAGTPRTN